ncbi:MAG: hypothetical protein HY360_25315 [Verrucomicrobia bacterium]|nr:hypothetical protein [Verrucomicrobiota bacterium]
MKKITLTYNGLSGCKDETNVEVFYEPLATNNPGLPPEDAPPGLNAPEVQPAISGSPQINSKPKFRK